MELKDLLDIYAELNEKDRNITEGDYYIGLVDAYDLLDAYLRNEGIYGYTLELMSIFRTLKDIID